MLFVIAEDPYGGLQLFVNAVPRGLTSFSGFHMNHKSSRYTCMHTYIQKSMYIK